MTTQTTKIARGEDTRLADHRPREFRVGTLLLDRYEVVAILGASQMGEVWQCFDRQTGQEVAIRWLPPDLRRSKKMLNVLHAEIRRIAGQRHPNVAIIRQIVHAGEQTYVVGDYAPGMDVETWARQGAAGRRTLDELLPLLAQIAAGLDFAHQQRIAHCNLTPSNVFIGPDGVVRVTDFGLMTRRHVEFVRGKATRTGVTGTYLAPELRTEDSEPDSGSDQYALAILAWDLLAGAPPALDDAPPDFLPGSARAALRRATAPKPRNRFATCADFVRALGGERVASRRGRSQSEWRHIRRCIGVALTLPVVVAGLGLGGFLVVQAIRNPAPPPERKAATPIKPEPVAAKKNAAPAMPVVQKLVATTPLPVEGQPWVTQTGQMEFVWVPPLGLWVGRFEVTNEEYAQMDPAHDSGEFRELSLRDPRQPVVRVNFDDTAAYAAWLTEQERAAGKLRPGWRYRLPSRAEAIAYTRAGLAAVFPWGEAWPPNRGNYGDESLAAAFRDLQFISGYQDGFAVTAPVEASGENAWGLFGAGGNVWETTSKIAGGAEFGGWHGGGWDDHATARLGCEMTYGFLGNARGAVNGFRLVLAPIAGEEPPPPAAKAPAAAPSPG